MSFNSISYGTTHLFWQQLFAACPHERQHSARPTLWCLRKQKSGGIGDDASTFFTGCYLTLFDNYRMQEAQWYYLRVLA